MMTVDLAILDRLEFGGADLAFGAALARLLQRRGPQQAADLIGTEWRLGSFHWFTPGISGRMMNLDRGRQL